MDVTGLASIPDLTFGGVTLRPSIREFECRTRRLTLEPRVMQVLIVLAEAAGAVVSRDQLIQSCWDGRAVSEDAVNRCIGQLRRLAKGCGEPCFTIECIPRVGYRLIVTNLATPRGAATTAAPCSGRRLRATLYGALLAQQSACLLAYGGHDVASLHIPWAVQASGPLLAVAGLALSLLRPRAV